MKTATPHPVSRAKRARMRVEQRRSVWKALIAICGKLEQLQADPEARRACREVRTELRRAWREEKADGTGER